MSMNSPINIMQEKQNDENGNSSKFSNGERTLLKLKINELEKEIKELREENEHVYKSLVDNS